MQEILHHRLSKNDIDVEYEKNRETYDLIAEARVLRGKLSIIAGEDRNRLYYTFFGFIFNTLTLSFAFSLLLFGTFFYGIFIITKDLEVLSFLSKTPESTILTLLGAITLVISILLSINYSGYVKHKRETARILLDEINKNLYILESDDSE